MLFFPPTQLFLFPQYSPYLLRFSYIIILSPALPFLHLLCIKLTSKFFTGFLYASDCLLALLLPPSPEAWSTELQGHKTELVRWLKEEQYCLFFIHFLCLFEKHSLSSTFHYLVLLCKYLTKKKISQESLLVSITVIWEMNPMEKLLQVFQSNIFTWQDTCVCVCVYIYIHVKIQ